MLCELCGEKQAVIHFTEITDGEVKHLHLCSDCAKLKEIASTTEPGKTHTTPKAKPLIQVLQKLLAADSEEVELRCGQCGHAYADFRSTGRLGCSTCYTAFAEKLEILLKRVHGSDKHRGKVPECMDEKVRLHRERGRLKRELEKAISNEEFEEAARLRDEIRAVEEQVTGARETQADGSS